MYDSYSMALSAHLGTLDYARAPHAVRERVRTALLYNIVLGLAGRSADTEMDDRFQTLHASQGRAVILGSHNRRTPEDAAFINAALIAARAQNDTYPALVAHVGCVVVPAALAAATASPCSGTELLTGLLRAYETVAILGKNSADETNRRGFRSTPLFSIFGASAAASSILRSTPRETASALAIAANFAGGLKQCWEDGSDEWRLHVANASRLGYMATLYARAGIVGSQKSFEGGNGFFRAFCGAVPTLDMSSWSIPQLTFKPYAGCAFGQAPVHILRTALAREKPNIQRISHLVVHMNPEHADYPGVRNSGPFASQAAAFMSTPFMLAATLLHGAPALSHFSELREDVRLTRLSRIVEVRSDPEMPRWRCRIEIRMDDDRRIEMATGPDEPFALSWAEAQEVLATVASDWGGSDQIGRFHALAAIVDKLEQYEETGALITAVGHGSQ